MARLIKHIRLRDELKEHTQSRVTNLKWQYSEKKVNEICQQNALKGGQPKMEALFKTQRNEISRDKP
jgi:hypothetical protein